MTEPGYRSSYQLQLPVREDSHGPQLGHEVTEYSAHIPFSPLNAALHLDSLPVI